MAFPDAQGPVSRSVREYDPDRYIATLFAPPQARPALMALYAFNIDVARIPESVSEPMLGEIRLQWWRDALETLEQGGVTGNPVADALGRAIRTRGLPKAILTGAIDGRSFDLSGDVMPDRQALKAYLAKTNGGLFAGAARIIANGPAPGAERLAGEAGHVWGLVGLLRALPLHLSRGRLYLPASDFKDAGADPQELLRGEADEKARAALKRLRDEARQAWAGLRGAVNALPAGERTAFLQLALVPVYLNAIEIQADKPLESVVEIGPLTRMTRLTWAAARGRI